VGRALLSSPESHLLSGVEIKGKRGMKEVEE